MGKKSRPKPSRRRASKKSGRRSSPGRKASGSRRKKVRSVRPKKAGRRRHPDVHFGLDGDKPWFVGEMKSVRVKHLGFGGNLKVKRELKVSSLNERRQLRGVYKDPNVLLNTERKGPRPLPAQRPRSASGPFPTVVVCGLGFAGLEVAKRLKAHLGAKGRVIGIDQSDRFVYVPALMAMASGFFKYEEISAPLKDWASRSGVEFIHDAIVSIDCAARKVHTKSRVLHYDYCVYALGASSTPLPQGFDSRTLGLRNVCDAYAVWDRLVKASSALAHKAGSRRFDVRVGIVGGGPTGVQLASWMADGLQAYLGKDYPRRGRAVVSLFHGGPELLSGLPKRARKAALEILTRQGVNVHLNTKVHSVSDNSVRLADGTSFRNESVIFCGGYMQSPVLDSLAVSKDGRCGVKVEATLQSVDDPFLFVAGDAACFVPDILNLPGWKRAQNANLVADTLAYNIVQHGQGQALESFSIKDTPVIIDLRKKSIYVSGSKVYVSPLFYLMAQLIRKVGMFKIRNPGLPFLG